MMYRSNCALAIFSGSLLEKRKEWEQVKEKLPNHTYLLVTPLDNAALTQIMMRIGRALQKAGVGVMVLSVG